MKSPLSGSGKGLRWGMAGELSQSDLGWCKNVITRQGSVMVEKRREVVQDFAMLFHVGESSVEFEGYSMFFSDNGIYKGNILASDEWILTELSRTAARQLCFRGGCGAYHDAEVRDVLASLPAGTGV